jgi:hypothetical protein
MPLVRAGACVGAHVSLQSGEVGQSAAAITAMRRAAGMAPRGEQAGEHQPGNLAHRLTHHGQRSHRVGCGPGLVYLFPLRVTYR